VRTLVRQETSLSAARRRKRSGFLNGSNPLDWPFGTVRPTVANGSRMIAHQKGYKMAAPLHTAKLALLLPTVLNPATVAVAVVGIGLIAVGLLRWLGDDEEEPTVVAVQLSAPKSAVGTVVEPLPAVELSEDKRVYEPYNDAMEAVETAPETLATPRAAITEAEQSEMIRKAMSELGKRSAVARAEKKAQRGKRD
jgi:hypothetical protein